MSSQYYSEKAHSRAITELPLISHNVLPIQRLLQMYPSALNCDRLARNEVAHGNIGPGYYNCPASTLGGPGFVFSSTQRFSGCLSGISSPVLKEFPDFKTKNKAMKPFRPDNKIELLKRRAESEDIKIKQVIYKKKQIGQQMKRAKLEKIKKKHYKFQLKIQYLQVNSIQKSWFALLSLISFANSARNIGKYTKNLHQRSRKLLKSLIIFLRVYAKFKISLIKFRIRKATKVLDKIAIKVRIWVKKNKANYLKMISEFLITATTQDKIFRLMYNWKNALVFIQRNLKKLLMHKRIGKALRLLQWNKIEKSLNEMKLGIKYSARVKFNSTVPLLIKEGVIRKNLKVRVKEYCKVLKEFNQNIEILMEKYKIRVEKDKMKQKKSAIFNIPDKPIPDYKFSKQDYLRMIKISFNVRRQSQISVDGPIKKRFTQFFN